MEPNNNMQNDNVSEPRPVRAPGFANGSANGGNAADVVAPVNGGNDVVFQDKPKKNHGMLYGMILLAILAVGGIGFGVWAMLDGNTRSQKKDEQISQLQSQLAEKSEVVVEDDTTVVESDKKVSNELAQNLINPYLGTFTYLNDIFDHEFNENTKFYLAFKNLSENDIFQFGAQTTEAGQASVTYDTINSEYQYLFGNNNSLDKTNYEEGYSKFTYENENWGGGKFVIQKFGGGGTGFNVFSVVKDAYYGDDNSIVIEVYHGKGTICGMDGGDDSYCFSELVGYSVTMTPSVEKLLNDSRTEVRKMIFVENDGHYVLQSVE